MNTSPSSFVVSQSVNLRRETTVDKLLAEAGRAIQVLSGAIPATRPNPAGKLAFSSNDEGSDEINGLSRKQARHAAGLMRVNHVGEVCAQALYRGQALFCRDAAIKEMFLKAAAEEVDHLVWCNQRLLELQSRPSILNPFWYAGSLTLGMIASRSGIERNLGFMAETEHQVEEHLNRHLQQLPEKDERSRAIVVQMRQDEINHRHTAEAQGARKLPLPIRLAMRTMSKIMTTTAYRF